MAKQKPSIDPLMTAQTPKEYHIPMVLSFLLGEARQIGSSIRRNDKPFEEFINELKLKFINDFDILH